MNLCSRPAYASFLAVATALGPPAAGQEASEADAEADEVVVVIGSRFQTERSDSQATAPVDILSAEEIGAIGNNADLTDSLRALAPSYNAPMASGDGDTFVRPTSLRGLAPDQTLVMVNGKRRHRAALIAEFVPAAGKGSHGPNIGMIPSIAVKNVQILRDGAVAQYGSDAIAGVINLEMKDAAQGGEVRVDYGQFYEGEQSVTLAANAGFALGADGFANVSFEYVDNEGLSRGRQRPNAQALIDAGVQGVGADAPFDDAPFVQTWGRPQTTDLRFFINAGWAVGDDLEAYLHSNVTATEGRYRFFYRAGDNPLTEANEAHVTIRTLGIENALPQGFTPFFDGDHDDKSLVAGVKGVLGDGTTFDLSIGAGEDFLDFLLNNTINQDLGLGANGLPRQMDFDVGALKQREVNVNADFTRRLTDTVQLAYGAEWREEIFSVFAGERSSFRGAGSSGFKGLEPRNAGRFSRDNVAVYGEIDQEVSLATRAQYALRYENFSDFGGTLNGKVALRHDLNDTITLRGSVNTGFPAPTPGQSNLQKVTTTFDNDHRVCGRVGHGPSGPSPAAFPPAGQREETRSTTRWLWRRRERVRHLDGYLIRLTGGFQDREPDRTPTRTPDRLQRAVLPKLTCASTIGGVALGGGRLGSLSRQLKLTSSPRPLAPLGRKLCELGPFIPGPARLRTWRPRPGPLVQRRSRWGGGGGGSGRGCRDHFGELRSNNPPFTYELWTTTSAPRWESLVRPKQITNGRALRERGPHGRGRLAEPPAQASRPHPVQVGWGSIGYT